MPIGVLADRSLSWFRFDFEDKKNQRSERPVDGSHNSHFCTADNLGDGERHAAGAGFE
jgi:hypothetical protein